MLKTLQMICYSKINIPSPLFNIKKEISTLSKNWELHFNKSHYEGNWSAMALRSPGGKDLIIPDARNDEPYQDTTLMDECEKRGGPAVRARIRHLP